MRFLRVFSRMRRSGDAAFATSWTLRRWSFCVGPSPTQIRLEERLDDGECQPLETFRLACQPESRPQGERRLVSRIFASWNQLDNWMRQVNRLRTAV